MATQTLNLDSLTSTQGIRVTNFNGIGINSNIAPWGAYVSNIGDINNDGYPDAVMSSVNGDLGEINVIYGNGSFPSTLNVPIAAPYGFTLIGISSRTGYSVSGAGDINGDGCDDFIVSDPYAPDNLGTVWGIYGCAPDFPSTIYLNDLGTRGFNITGNADEFGRWVSRVGDVNKDGLADFIIGNPYASSKGISFLVYGNRTFPNEISWSSISQGDYGPLIYGGGTIICGNALSGGIDFNKDGFDDVLTASSGGNGYLVIVWGNASLPKTITLSTLGEENLFSVIEGIHGTGFAYSVGGVGDFDQDGYGDLVTAATVINTVYIIKGQPVFPIFTTIEDISNQVVTVTATSGRFGYAVSGAGDINNDGYSDVLAGNPVSNEAVVIYGNKTSPLTMQVDNLGEYGFKMISTYGYLGGSVSSAGDLDKNGFDDMLCTAYHSNEGFIIHGAASGFATSSPTSTPTELATGQPTSIPSGQPTIIPSGEPTGAPSNSDETASSDDSISTGIVVGIAIGGMALLLSGYCIFARIKHWWPFISSINNDAPELGLKEVSGTVTNPIGVDDTTKCGGGVENLDA